MIYLLALINHIFHAGDIPELLKTGVLTPVFKRKGSKNHSTNYRGITILPVICKIIEAILKERISPHCDRAQNPYQRGFTRNASPMNAGLIVEEFLRESKDNNLTAHLILLDAKSAFDVVDHAHMLRRLFHIGVQDKHWSLISSLHKDASSVVKWFGEQSNSFKIHQGVRQGGIVSTDLYKIYQNPLLNRIQHSGLGARVGNVTCNISGCADDLAVNVNSRREGQVLVNASTDHANMERYLLQVDKSVMVTVTPRDSNNIVNTTEPITMNGKEMKTVESAMHLGIHRTTTISKNSELNVEENLKKARRVVYSLMSSGMHGHNGLDPETNLHLVKTYVLPVLLYGLELVLPCKTLINKLETYQKKMLKQILSLPTSTADVAIYVISGFLPVEGQIDKKILTLLNNVARQDNTSVEKEIAIRQLTIKNEKSNSWFVHARKIFLKYELGDIHEHLVNPPEKNPWKATVNKTVNKYWQNDIITSSAFYSTMEFLNMKSYKLGTIHPLLKINIHSARDVIRLPSKLRLMCGSYVLQTTRSKFKNTQINSKCLLCGNAEETVEHYILLCETLEKFRNPILTKISETYLNLTGKEYRILDNRSKLQIIIDCSVLLSQESILNKRLKIQDLSSLEFHARRLTHVLHTNRYRLLNHPDQIE